MTAAVTFLSVVLMAGDIARRGAGDSPSPTSVSLRLDRRVYSHLLLGEGLAVQAGTSTPVLRQAGPRVGPPVEPEGCGSRDQQCLPNSPFAIRSRGSRGRKAAGLDHIRISPARPESLLASAVCQRTCGSGRDINTGAVASGTKSGPSGQAGGIRELGSVVPIQITLSHSISGEQAQKDCRTRPYPCPSGLTGGSTRIGCCAKNARLLPERQHRTCGKRAREWALRSSRRDTGFGKTAHNLDHHPACATYTPP